MTSVCFSIPESDFGILLKKIILPFDEQFKKSVFLQPEILEQKELKIKKLKGKKIYAYHSTISKKGKKKTYFAK